MRASRDKVWGGWLPKLNVRGSSPLTRSGVALQVLPVNVLPAKGRSSAADVLPSAALFYYEVLSEVSLEVVTGLLDWMVIRSSSHATINWRRTSVRCRL